MEVSRYETDYSLVFRKVTAKGYSLILRGFRRRERESLVGRGWLLSWKRELFPWVNIVFCIRLEEPKVKPENMPSSNCLNHYRVEFIVKIVLVILRALVNVFGFTVIT